METMWNTHKNLLIMQILKLKPVLMPQTSALRIKIVDNLKKEKQGCPASQSIYKGEINGISASSNERFQRVKLLELGITVSWY
jgi:hypothetical protein